MIVEGEFTFQGPREVIWELLQDPTVLVKALPGAKTLTRTAEDRYEGVMSVGVGPVTAGEFSVSVVLGDKVPPQSFSMQTEGKGGIGFSRGTARVELTALPGGGTLMKYRADLQVGGKIAGVGQRVLDSASRAMTRQGLEALNREVQARVSGAPASGPAPAAVRWRKHYWIAAAVALVALIFTLCAQQGP